MAHSDRKRFWERLLGKTKVGELPWEGPNEHGAFHLVVGPLEVWCYEVGSCCVTVRVDGVELDQVDYSGDNRNQDLRDLALELRRYLTQWQDTKPQWPAALAALESCSAKPCVWCGQDNRALCTLCENGHEESPAGGWAYYQVKE